MLTQKELDNLLEEVPEHTASVDRWSRIIDTVGVVCAVCAFLGALLAGWVETTHWAGRISGILGGLLSAVIIWAGFRITAVVMRVFSDISKNTYRSAVYQRAQYEHTRPEESAGE